MKDMAMSSPPPSSPTLSATTAAATMLGVRDDFDTRVDEIENYFRFVDHMDGGQLQLTVNAGLGGVAPASGETDLWMKTLKANCFLLLYNLVESTMSNAIQAIFDELQAVDVSFDDCREEVKRVAIKNLNQHNAFEISPRLARISLHIITETFRKDKLFSGNLDAKRIREVALEYGFVPPRTRSDGLLTVKTNRNHLAHGNKSFGQVGRDYSVGDLVIIKDQVGRHLASVVDNVEDYIVKRLYLAVPPASSGATVTTAVPVTTP